MSDWTVLKGDCIEQLATLGSGSINCCVTSPPYYGLRDYGHEAQIGLEATPEAYVAKLVEVFREVRRVLRDDGTLWLNLGDSYNAHPGQRKTTDKAGEKQQSVRGASAAPSRSVDGLKPKDLIGIPWRVAFALQADGWWLRQDIIWHKPNPMPESVTDRCTKAHEYLFLLSKSERYYFDCDSIKEDAKTWTGRAATFDRSGNAVSGHVLPGQSAAQHRARVDETARKSLRSDVESRHRSSIPGGQSMQAVPTPKRNKRDVWSVSTKPFKGAHFATFPPKLVEPCVLAGCPVGGTVLDPFGGSGTTAAVAIEHGRKAVLCEINEEYIQLALRRMAASQRRLFA